MKVIFKNTVLVFQQKEYVEQILAYPTNDRTIDETTLASLLTSKITGAWATQPNTGSPDYTIIKHCRVTKIKYYVSATNISTINIYQDATVIATLTDPSQVSQGWHEYTFDSPIELSSSSTNIGIDNISYCSNKTDYPGKSYSWQDNKWTFNSFAIGLIIYGYNLD